MRDKYQNRGLDLAEVATSPLDQFATWYAEIQGSGLHEPNTVVLATADSRGRPSTRHVLVKQVDAHGFSFFTNYTSAKAQDLTANPWASIVFTWSELARQVIVNGPVERIDEAASDAYYASRPRTSQLGAWASHQSQPLNSRAELEDRYEDYAELHALNDVPRPAHWGGFRVGIETIEFWQGRPNRMHDRIRYRSRGTSWSVERLNP